MNDSTRRAIRTALDVLPAFLAALLIMVPVLGFDAGTVAQVGAVIGAITLALAKVRNALEDAGVIPALLKAPPSAGANPVPDDAGQGEVRLILMLAAGILLALVVWSLLGAHTDWFVHT